jgi:hypothetical protein
MADNETVDNGGLTDYRVATDKVTYEGDADANIQLVKLVTVSGTEGSKTATAVQTGVQYVEDTALPADAGQGTLVIARRDDALSTLTPADGDAVGLRVNDKGALWSANDVTHLTWGQSDGVTAANVTGDSNNALLWVYNGTTIDRVRSGGATGMLGVAGAAGHASPTSGNPVYVAGRASAVIPTDVGADGDAAGFWLNRNGANMVSVAPHIGLNSDPWNLVHEAAQYTSAQTSTVLVTGGASEKIVVTKAQIQAFATTAGTAILYFGTGAFSRGTSRAVFDGEFAPSATSKPGVVLDGPFIAGTNGDDLLVTTTNALSITFNVWYYVIT